MSRWFRKGTRTVNVNTVLLALVMGLSPLAVLASVLLLTVERGTAKAAAYAVGWVVATSLVGVATIAVDSWAEMPPGNSASTASAWLDVALGVILVVLAIRRRVRGASGTTEPSWMRKLDSMSPVVALGFGLFMPPYVLAVAGANNIVRSSQSDGTSSVVLAVVVFTIVASVGVLVPLALAVFSSRSDEVLARWRTWLMANWPRLVVWLLAAIGVYLVVKGVYELAG